LQCDELTFKKQVHYCRNLGKKLSKFLPLLDC